MASRYDVCNCRVITQTSRPTRLLLSCNKVVSNDSFVNFCIKKLTISLQSYNFTRVNRYKRSKFQWSLKIQEQISVFCNKLALCYEVFEWFCFEVYFILVLWCATQRIRAIMWRTPCKHAVIYIISNEISHFSWQYSKYIG